MAAAYVLIEVLPQENVKETVESIRNVAGIKAANAVAGPYDIVAELEAADFNAVSDTVVNNIRPIKGVGKTITLNVLA